MSLFSISVFAAPRLGAVRAQISDLAGQSSCNHYSWKNRGRAPAGYIKGVALSFARSVCRTHSRVESLTTCRTLTSANSNNTKKDVLAYFDSILSNQGLRTNVSGEEPILAVYSVGMGLGMRESSGKYCEGWDVAAGANRSSAEAEAGMFQTSYDSIRNVVDLNNLYAEYQAHPERCLLNVFKEGVSCKAQSILGSGAGATFQRFNKVCPAFAAEYAMTLLRVQRSHFGPINRKQAEVVPACVSLLSSVQKLIDHDPAAVCQELL